MFWHIPAWAAAVSAVAFLSAAAVPAGDSAAAAAKPLQQLAAAAPQAAKAAPRSAPKAHAAAKAVPQPARKADRATRPAEQPVAKRAPVEWVPAARRAYGDAGRPDAAITKIIVHVAQASAGSVVNTFKNGAAGSSAHYVVSATGDVTQMVPDHAVAWHAGNRVYNAASIGIEHAGYVDNAESFTDPMYRASGRLIGHLAEKYDIPLDRLHVIGHNEVPDPDEPGKVGGFDGHTDPGRHWNWEKYMEYARSSQAGADAEQTRAEPAGEPAGEVTDEVAGRVDELLEPRPEDLPWP